MLTELNSHLLTDWYYGQSNDNISAEGSVVISVSLTTEVVKLFGERALAAPEFGIKDRVL